MKMDKPQCLLYAAAMVLDKPPEVLIHEIGHDGMTMIWPHLPRPLCYKSMHIQEIMDVFILYGYGLVLIEQYPYQAPNNHVPPHKTYKNNEQRFNKIIKSREAIMIGKRKDSNIGHAWAWDGCECYDPNGMICGINEYNIQEAWIKTKMI
jgi:hypothetical protein